MRVCWVLPLLLLGCSKTPTPPPVVTLPEGMVLVPAGEFMMGSNQVDKSGKQEEFGFREPMYLDEHPQHRVVVGAFYIDEYEVRSVDYKQFILETGAEPPPTWVQSGYNVSQMRLGEFDLEALRGIAADYFQLDMDTSRLDKPQLLAELVKIQQQQDELPVTAVKWYDAATYCLWRGKRLPTEAEWEKAARGTDGRDYPWGGEWLPSMSNIGDGEAVLAKVGSYVGDRSVYGVYDLGGNVSEWVDDWYRAYPGAKYQSPFAGDIHKVIKGGGAGVGHYALSYFFRSARRGQADPSAMSTDVGFRCAQSAG